MEVSRPLSRRTFLAGAGAAGAALAADSMFPGTSRAARPEAPVNITYWQPWGGDSQVSDANRAKQFNATHPNIHATPVYVPQSAGVANGKLLSAIASGNVPDLVVTDMSTAGAIMGYQGGLVDCMPYLKHLGWSPNQMLPGVLQGMMYNGKVWALPEAGNLWYLYINRTLAKKAGLDPSKPPVTIADLDAWADKLTVMNGSKFETIGFIPWAYEGGGAGASVYTWGQVFGANFTQVVNGKVKLTLTDPAFIRSLNWEASYAKKYGADKLQVAATNTLNPFTANDLFITGELAMMVGGNWHTEALRVYGPKIDYVCYPIPYPPGGRKNASIMSFNFYMVPVGSKHPLEAVTFAMWCGSGPAIVGNADMWRSFSGYKQKPGDPVSIWVKNHDHTYSVIQMLAASPNTGSGVMLPISAQLANDLWAAEQKVIYGQATAESALAEVQNRLQPILDKALNQ